jgi:8-oxo-dGTP pyrophosphatase MutT (NUDIX family)
VREIARFEVGLKAFLVREGRLLVVRERVAPQWWELPGGRFDAGEEMTPLEHILRRELREELGDALVCDIVGPRDAWVRPAPERGTHVFLLGFLCRHRAGEIQLSDEHVDARWIGAGEERDLALAEPYAKVLGRFWERGAEPARA